MNDRQWSALRCPRCHGALRGDDQLRCEAGHRWPVDGEIPLFFAPRDLRWSDRLFRRIYDVVAPLHNAAVTYVLPLLQGESEATLRDGYMRRLDLASLRAPSDGAPLRILEVGFGAGANLSLLRRDLPRDVPVEIWGTDISMGMVNAFRRGRPRGADRDLTLVLADVHDLPFADATFDRVFHVGAAGTFGDPRRALTEMARVAKPGTPVVVVDEQLDPNRDHGLYHRAVYSLFTIYAPTSHCPREALPPDAGEVLEEQVSRFYYCLTFRAPLTPPKTPS